MDPTKTTNQWLDEFYQESNNFENFEYESLNEIIFKSKKITRYKTKDKILFDGENIIATDNRGNIVIYSIDKKEITYKKKHESKNKGISSYAILAKVHPVEGNTMTAIQTYCNTTLIHHANTPR